jgi:hypothetical protein
MPTPVAVCARGQIRPWRIVMPDPISEYAEYLVVARDGITRLYLYQGGRLQDPGTVAVVRDPSGGGAQTLARWLNRVRHAVQSWLRGIDVVDPGTSPRSTAANPSYEAAPPRSRPVGALRVPEQSSPPLGRDAGAVRSPSGQSGDHRRARDVA